MAYRVEFAASAEIQLEELYLWVVERTPRRRLVQRSRAGPNACFPTRGGDSGGVPGARFSARWGALPGPPTRVLQRVGVGVAGWTGLEPAASGVTGRRSNQLNYHP